MKIVVRAADYAMTDSITDGCLKAIRDGILTDVGLMTNNYEHAKRAVEEVMKFPHVSIGQDLNIVSGFPASEPEDIPSLVNEEGRFISSVERKANNLYDIPYAEIYLEFRNQIDRFIELVGRKPCYITGHSLNTPEVHKAMTDICDEYGILYDCFSQENLQVAKRWYYKNLIVDANDRKPSYSLDAQAQTDVIEHITGNEIKFDLKKDGFGMIATHCGYCDGELLNMSTFSVIRGREVEALCSDEVKLWIRENDIELVNFDDYLAKDR